jgi:hypothetical protein
MAQTIKEDRPGRTGSGWLYRPVPSRDLTAGGHGILKRVTVLTRGS